jgi:hypothetical protein
MRQRIRILVVVQSAVMGMSSVWAQDRLAVEDPRPLMLAALEAPSGEAHGILTGTRADAIRARFNAAGPILIDVRTERRLAQAGCSRLVVSFHQDGVRLPEPPDPRRQVLDIGINYCRDGLPPRSTR